MITGDLGLDPRPEKFLLQRTSRTMGEIQIKFVGWIIIIIKKKQTYLQM